MLLPPFPKARKCPAKNAANFPSPAVIQCIIVTIYSVDACRYSVHNCNNIQRRCLQTFQALHLVPFACGADSFAAARLVSESGKLAPVLVTRSLSSRAAAEHAA